MISGFLEIPVTVTYRSPSKGMPQWFGNGITDKYWPASQVEFETNIGEVHIFNRVMRRDGKHYIEFKGNGTPKGPLAKLMS